MALKKFVVKKNPLSNLVEKFLNFIATLPANKRLSLEEIAENFSEEIDKIILKTQDEGKTFITGMFSITLYGSMTFKPNVVMYFATSTTEKDNNLLSVTCDIPAQILSRLTPSSIIELKNKKKVEFEITSPTAQ